MPDIRVAFWNLENLFDHENAQRDPILKNRLRSELQGWTAAIRDQKISQLASIIEQMFTGYCQLSVRRMRLGPKRWPMSGSIRHTSPRPKYGKRELVVSDGWVLALGVGPLERDSG